MPLLPIAVYIFNAISIEITPTAFIDLEPIILKFVWNQKTPQVAKGMLKKEINAGGITMPDFNKYYKAVIFKTASHWPKNRHIGQGKRIENTEMDPQFYGQLIFDRAGKNIQ